MNTESSLLALAELLGKSVLILVAALLIICVCRRSSAARRHFLWLAVFLTLLLLPLTKAARPRFAFTLPQPQVVATVLPGIALNSATSERRDSFSTGSSTAGSRRWLLPNWFEIALLGWLAGTALVLAYRGLGTLQLASLRRRSVPMGAVEVRMFAETIAEECGMVRGFVELRVSRECIVPLTWGLRRPVIVLPDGAAKWPRERVVAVLRHEFGHVVRHDYLARLVAHFVCAIYWPNPLVWVAARRWRRTQEEACDDLVLRAGVRPEEYATHLVAIARCLRSGQALAGHALAMAQKSTLYSRVCAIVDPMRDRRPLSGGMAWLCIVSGTIALGGSALAQLDPSASPKTPSDAANIPADSSRGIDRSHRSRTLPELITKEYRLSREVIDRLGLESVTDGAEFLRGHGIPTPADGALSFRVDEGILKVRLPNETLPLVEKLLGFPAVSVFDKVVRLIIPEIELHEANLVEALAYLERMSIEADHEEVDPAKRGVRLGLEFPSEEFEKKGLSLGLIKVMPSGGVPPKPITLSLANISLLAAVAAVAREADLQVFVGLDAVVLHPPGFAPLGQPVTTSSSTSLSGLPIPDQAPQPRPRRARAGPVSRKPEAPQADENAVTIESAETKMENGIAYAKGDAKFSHAKETITSFEMQYDAKFRRFQAKGSGSHNPAKLSSGDVTITADVIRYKQDPKIVEASGNAVLTTAGQSVIENKLWFDLKTRTPIRESDFIEAWEKR